LSENEILSSLYGDIIPYILDWSTLEFLLKICIRQKAFQIMPIILPIILAMLSSPYYAKNYAGIIDSGLPRKLHAQLNNIRNYWLTCAPHAIVCHAACMHGSCMDTAISA